MGGKLQNLANLERLSLSEGEIAKYGLSQNDILINRVNSIEYLGKSALVPFLDEPTVFESNMMRFTVDETQMLPSFLNAFLQTPLGLYDLRRRAKHAINQASVNQGDVSSLRVPVPSLTEQREFLKRTDAPESILASQLESDSLVVSLVQSLLAHGFSGELTGEFREANREQLEKETVERDDWLRETGVKLTVAERKIGVEKTKDEDDRHAKLNREQRELLNQIKSLELEDSIGTFTLSTLFDELSEPLDRLTLDSVRRHLDVLSVRGLVISVSRQAGTGGSVGVAFGNAFRLPISEEFADKFGLPSDDARGIELHASFVGAEIYSRRRQFKPKPPYPLLQTWKENDSEQETLPQDPAFTKK